MQNKLKNSVSIFRVLGIIFLALGIIFLANTVSLWIRQSVWGASESKGYYCIFAPAGSKALGDTYEGVQAEEGYSFYRLEFKVTNQGNASRYGDEYYGVYFNDTKGNRDDVLDWWPTDTGREEEPKDDTVYLFEGADYNYLPAGRQLRYFKVVQVRDGVKSFSVDYYPSGDSDDEQLSFVMSL